MTRLIFSWSGGFHDGMPGGMMMAGATQGLELDILTFAVDRFGPHVGMTTGNRKPPNNQ